MSSRSATSNQQKEWFDEWFDSPYYHLLYKHRDQEEAQNFIDHLAEYFHFKEGEKAMDLACGKGRHSIYLADKGLDVVGLDLSEKNITYASRQAHDRLHFEVHDMRKLYKAKEFDYVFNLFTSFGYFDSYKENEQTICAVSKSLKANGYLVIDFLNPQVVIDQLIPAEIKTMDHIDFRISRFLEKGYIVKNIQFEDDGETYFYQERVKAITKDEFLSYFEAAGLEVKEIFGNYNLEAYNLHNSQRMIFIVQKTGIPC